MEVRVFDIMFIFVFVFQIALLTSFSIFIYQQVLTVSVLSALPEVADIFNGVLNSLNKVDDYTIIWVLLLGLVNFLSGFFQRNSPVFFIFEFILYTFSFIPFVALKGMLETLMKDPRILDGVLTAQSSSVFVIDNMVYFYIGLSTFYFLGMYMKTEFVKRGIVSEKFVGGLG